jgi:hypothetical protein
VSERLREKEGREKEKKVGVGRMVGVRERREERE